ncbi:ATP-binding cassette domain-containing protein [Cnuibacter physcomitrellae]|uniref:ABC transporter ATP-binding protein n=1 Tax=Cnuibacter physcomitrellae TaxID=1619308 RepID=UPI002175C029|nr:ATP-binding cassette domain-containing protein [Cnuibacter physcomitrellae]MCS5497825.1 ATP-binding cassette domain-containing protein [Cnuibacter physcomitrellae]
MKDTLRADRVSVEVDAQRLLPPTSLEAAPGESVALRGPNGSGKTTLLRVLAGLQRPTSGSVSLGALRIDDRDRRFRAAVAGLIGMPPFARDLTLAEQLAFVGISWGVPRDAADRRATTLLDELSLVALASRYPHELSSGQTQLASIALTLARPFDVLLLDEPEQRLDADRLGLVAQALRRRLDEGAAIVFATHSDELSALLAGREVTVGTA